MFWQIMIFYAVLSCFAMPLIGQYINGNAGLGQGYVAGTLFSLFLWFYVGKKYAQL